MNCSICRLASGRFKVGWLASWMLLAILWGFALSGACAAEGESSASEFDAAATRKIAEGWFWQGSDDFERNYAYDIDARSYGSDVTHKTRLYEREADKWHLFVPSFEMMVTPVTNAQYAKFIAETSHRVPFISQEEWDAEGFVYRYDLVKKFMWEGQMPPRGREDHPVVLVSWRDAVAYAKWLSKKTHQRWHLPSEIFWEKAIRGTKGSFYPWGNIFDPKALNSAEGGVFDTTPVGQYPPGQFGIYDGVGQVWEWTSSSLVAGNWIVKGGSWDDRGCGVCRPAARQSRPEYLRHILIGFRLVRLKN